MRTCLVLALVATAYAQRIVTVPAGTAVQLAAGRAVSSATDRPGDAVNFELQEDVTAGGAVVAAKGATVRGVISAVGTGRKGGVLQIKLQDLRLPNGTSVRLGTTPPGTAPGIPVMTAGVLPVVVDAGGNATVSVRAASNDAFMVRGYRVTAYVQQAVAVDASKLLRPSAPPAPQTAMTNEDVIRLFQAGRSEADIVALIQAAPGNYRLAAADIAALKRAGLTSRIIEEMLAKR